MPNKMTVALLQLPVHQDKQANIHQALCAIRDAHAKGAHIALLPEMFVCPYDSAVFSHYGESVGGETQQALGALAKELGIYIVGGSIPEREGDRLYNTAFVYDRQGVCIARHRKVHLFDIHVQGGQHFQESATLSAGDAITVFDTVFGPMGLCICFDLRFEELSRCMALAGAKAIFCPAAFNPTTGPAHWELLFRQRAVDNQLFTFGASPAPDPHAHYVAYGHSIAVDPWGIVLADAKETAQTLLVDVDLDRLDAVRAQLPILSARRTDLYLCQAR